MTTTKGKDARKLDTLLKTLEKTPIKRFRGRDIDARSLPELCTGYGESWHFVASRTGIYTGEAREYSLAPDDKYSIKIAHLIGHWRLPDCMPNFDGLDLDCGETEHVNTIHLIEFFNKELRSHFISTRVSSTYSTRLKKFFKKLNDYHGKKVSEESRLQTISEEDKKKQAAKEARDEIERSRSKIGTEKLLTINASEYCACVDKDLSEFTPRGVHIQSLKGRDEAIRDFIQKVPYGTEVVVSFKSSYTVVSHLATDIYGLLASGTALIPKQNGFRR